MFDFIRKHTKITMGLLFLLIVPSFVLFGLDGYNKNKDKAEVVAKVDGQEITQTDWDRAHLREVERLRASMPSLDPKLLDSPEARYAVLERLVRDRVLLAAAEKFHLAPTDQRLANDLQRSPEIAALRRPDGTLDMERYRAVLGAQGLSPEMFESKVRSELSSRQVLMGIAGSGFAPTAVADMALNAYFEKREIQLARFSAAEYALKIQPTETELEQYYKTNENFFRAPEQANIEYVQLDVDTLKRGITVSEADLKAYYDQNAARMSGIEERRASHILIASPKNAPEAERQKAKAKAIELLAQVKKAPDSFADAARKNSQDPGSAPQGGDLEFFTRDAMVKPFSDAAFAMKKGEVSDVVESDFGYHIIKLTDIKMPKQRTYEEMKSELEADVKKQLAQKKFSESAEAFSNGVYEQSDSLKPIADRLKLEVKTAEGVTRQPRPGVNGALSNVKLLNAIFSPDVIEKKRNTDAIETASGQLISARITQYMPAQTKPFAQVKEQVRQRLVAARGAEEARKEGAAKLAAWKADPATENLLPPMVVSREQTQRLPPLVVEAALKTDATHLPVLVGVDLGQAGYTIIKLIKVLPPDAAAVNTALKQEREQYAQWWTAAEGLAYFNSLKERFKADIRVAKPKRASTDPQATPETATQ